MQVLSHRGYWLDAAEKNTETAFARSFRLGFGTETDVRDYLGELVIAHDVPREPPMPLARFVEILEANAPISVPLAINIKADGLASMLARQMEGSRHPWFVFDMSVPDLREQLKAGNPTYARVSEYEELPELLAGAVRGVWLDAFIDQWFTVDTIRSLLDRGLELCVVSPELHRREPRAVWDMLGEFAVAPGLSICTDLPERCLEHLGLPSPLAAANG